MIKTIRKWIRHIKENKIQIIIVTPAENVDRITESVIYNEIPPAVNHTQTNIRFVHNKKTDHQGRESEHWCTEEYTHGKWRYVFESLACNKEKAMELHIKIANKIDLQPTETKEILWQGLDKEETESWVNLQK